MKITAECSICKRIRTQKFYGNLICGTCYQRNKSPEQKEKEKLDRAKCRERDKEKINLKNKQRYKENKTVILNSNRVQRLKSKYNINEEKHNILIALQNNLCAICYRPEKSKNSNGITKRLAIDHSHKSGMVRGLLCQTCNHAIGLLEENVLFLENAIAYLNKHRE
ncbi:Endonuclease VII domain-containing protein [Azospirillaceae bacterium]